MEPILENPPEGRRCRTGIDFWNAEIKFAFFSSALRAAEHVPKSERRQYLISPVRRTGKVRAKRWRITYSFFLFCCCCCWKIRRSGKITLPCTRTFRAGGKFFFSRWMMVIRCSIWLSGSFFLSYCSSLGRHYSRSSSCGRTDFRVSASCTGNCGWISFANSPNPSIWLNDLLRRERESVTDNTITAGMLNQQSAIQMRFEKVLLKCLQSNREELLFCLA